MNLLIHQVIYDHSRCFESFSNCTHKRLVQFENVQTSLVPMHKSRNAIALVRFPKHTLTINSRPRVGYEARRTLDIGVPWHFPFVSLGGAFSGEIQRGRVSDHNEHQRRDMLGGSGCTGRFEHLSTLRCNLLHSGPGCSKAD